MGLIHDRHDYAATMLTMRPGIAWAALWGLAAQHRPPGAIHVCDNGTVSVASRYEWRFVVDLLAHRGIPVHVTRRMPAELLPSEMLHELIEQVDAERVFVTDDDVLLEPAVTAALMGALARTGAPYVCTLQLTPNDEQEVVGWAPPNIGEVPGFSDRPDGTLETVDRSSTHALMFRRSAYTGQLLAYDARVHGGSGHDDCLTAGLAAGSDVPGYLVVEPGARAWEMNHPESRRWKPGAYVEA